jgi:hypothetical protein
MYLSRLAARRQIRFRLNTEAACAHLGALAGHELLETPHGDTLNQFLASTPPTTLMDIAPAMVRSLLQGRRLEAFRLLDKYYLLAVDMTGHLFLGDHESAFTEGCLTQTAQDGGTLYYRPVCEAKLVTRNGLALSVGTEFVENLPRADQTDEQYKQDCEQKAFQRLFPIVKGRFPGFSFCVLLDSLHCNETGFSLSEANDWRFIITLKEGVLPSVMKEFTALRELCPENRMTLRTDKTRLDYAWVNAIPYGKRLLHVLECKQTDPDGNQKTFVWATDIEIHPKNCHPLATEGGRLRWKIENEGFRTQKHAGFEMEHAYAKRPQPAKNFYLLLQIAHNLSQLFEAYCQGKTEVKRALGSLRNLAHALLESFRRDPTTDPDQLNTFLNAPIQIRLDTS